MLPAPSYIAFLGNRRLAAGSPVAVATAAKRAADARNAEPLLVFDTSTSRPVDLDLRGTDAEVAARYREADTDTAPVNTTDDDAASPYRDDPARRGRGRPRLGVVAREVTLLPRHWDWLAAQPGGASAAVRRLVDDARRTHADRDRRRQAQESAYRFMSAMAGDAPGFEEATRALFAADAARFAEHTDAWPADVRDHARELAARAFSPATDG